MTDLTLREIGLGGAIHRVRFQHRLHARRCREHRRRLGAVPALAAEKQREEEGMIIGLYIAAAVIMTVGSLYFAWRSRDFRKFLAGAFFVSSGILFYLYLADVS